MNLEHKHLIVRAEVAGTPKLQDISFVEDWMSRLIKSVGMVTLIEPKAVYCDKENNRGITAIAALTTSSTTLHIWDEKPPCYLQFDLYSCKSFDYEHVLHAINEFGMTRYEYYMLNRETPFSHIHAKGHGLFEPSISK